MADRAHLSIGEVLGLLQGDFPDVTISKIRFLESQGLLDPERTKSGYRKFYEHDIAQLRWILTQQRDHFLPLKVIKSRLESGIRIEDQLAEPPPTVGRDDLPDQELNGTAGAGALGPVAGHGTNGDAGAQKAPPPGLGGDTEPPPAESSPADLAPSARPKGVENHPAARYHNQVADLAADERAVPPTWTRDESVSAPAADIESLPVAHLRAVDSSEPDSNPELERTGDPWWDASAPNPPRRLDRGPADVDMSFEELGQATGVTPDQLTELERFGLIQGRQVGPNMLYDEDSLATCRIVAGFLSHGLEVRHLRMYQLTAEREVAFIEQIVTPVLKQRNPAARETAISLIGEFVDLGDQLRVALMTRQLRNYLGND